MGFVLGIFLSIVLGRTVKGGIPSKAFSRILFAVWSSKRVFERDERDDENEEKQEQRKRRW